MYRPFILAIWLTFAILCTSSIIFANGDKQIQAVSDSPQPPLGLDPRLLNNCVNVREMELTYESFSKLQTMFDSVKERIDSASGLSGQLINHTLGRNGAQMDAVFAKLDAVGNICNRVIDSKGNVHTQELLTSSVINSFVLGVSSLKNTLSDLTTFTIGLKMILNKLQRSEPARFPKFPNKDYCPAAMEDGILCFKWRNNCYCISTNKKSWTDAFDTCQKYNTTLLSIESSQENEEITRLLKRLQWKERVWTSGNDLAEEGKWIWASTGQPVTYLNWHSKQPDNHGGNEHFLQLNNYDQNGKWNDYPGNYTCAFICELE